jgi:hypothetical protein
MRFEGKRATSRANAAPNFGQCRVSITQEQRARNRRWAMAAGQR